MESTTDIAEAKDSPSIAAPCSLPPAFYEDELVTIYHAYCEDVLDCIADVDLVLTDPPYGIRHCVNYGPKFRSKNQVKVKAAWYGKQIAGDESTELSEWIVRWIRDRGIKGAIFAHPDRPLTLGCQRLVWSKPSMGLPRYGRAFRKSFEDIYLYGDWSAKRVPMHGVLEGKAVECNESRGRKHPHEKPLWLLKTIIERSECKVIVDPCMGSGTTLLAAKAMGCRAVGIEIEESYCEVAASRCRNTASLFVQ